MLGADEMEPIIIAIHAIVNVDAVQMHSRALDDSDTVISAIQKRDVPDREVFASVDKDVVGTAVPTQAAGRWRAPNSGMELRALTVDCA